MRPGQDSIVSGASAPHNARVRGGFLPMSRIADTFARLRSGGNRAFIAYLTAGDPSVDDTVDIVLRLASAGVDVIELGLPFSDPLADGRVNAESAERALKAGTTLARVLDGVRRIRLASAVPLVLYTYLNPLLARGFEPTVRRIAAAGIDGLLILDLTPEEGGDYHAILRRAGVDPICLVTPTSTDERIRRIVRHASGFVYCISRTGVTGARRELSSDAAALLARVRRHTPLPLALGFGISTAGQTRQAAALADAVVVGSALVKRLHEAGRDPERREAVIQWAAGLARATKAVSASRARPSRARRGA